VAAFTRPGTPAGVPLVGMRAGAELPADIAARPVERFLGTDVDGAGGRVGVLVRAGGLENADRVDPGERGLLETEGPRAACASVGISRSEADAVDGDAGVIRWQAPQADVAHGAVAGAVGVNARHELHELSRVTFGDLAVRFRRQAIGDIHRRALFHKRPGIPFAHAYYAKCVELRCLAGNCCSAVQLNVLLD